jgi:Holliday junction DNA helicase RuvA
LIGFLRGVLMVKAPPQVVVDVNGVGYELDAPMSTCFDLPEIGTEVFLRTHLVVREDQHTLYGFATEQERQMFRDLLRVNGVGAKLALSILSGISVDGFVRCVQEEDKASLVRLPGVGKKTAERLILDMRDRIENQIANGGMALSEPGAGKGSHSEAFNALTSLGYKPAEARRMLDDAGGDGMSTEELLRSVLRAAASSN